MSDKQFKALTHIAKQLSGIDASDLTHAERNILRIVGEGLDQEIHQYKCGHVYLTDGVERQGGLWEKHDHKCQHCGGHE